jgi:hypothetical protein
MSEIAAQRFGVKVLGKLALCIAFFSVTMPLGIVIGDRPYYYIIISINKEYDNLPLLMNI